MLQILLLSFKKNYYIYLFYIIKIEYIKLIIKKWIDDSLLLKYTDCLFKIFYVDFKIFWKDFKIF